MYTYRKTELIFVASGFCKKRHKKWLELWLITSAQYAIGKQESKAKKIFTATLGHAPAIYLS